MDALQTGHLTIAGVSTATVWHPGHLNAADLPQVLIWPGLLRVGNQGPYFSRFDEVFIARVFVAPLGTGTDVNVEGYEEVIDLIDAFGHYYVQPSVRNLGGAVAHIGDPSSPYGFITLSGYTVLQYAGESFMGFEVTIPVTLKDTVEDV